VRPPDPPPHPQPPVAAKRPVTDEYWGKKIVDDYRWLEDGNDAAVRAWSDAQNAFARAHLDAAPHYAEIRARLAAIAEKRSQAYFGIVARGGAIFALEDQPPKQQAFLVVLKSVSTPDKDARVLVDPNALDPTGGTTIDWFVPSLDGKLVAVSLSQHGSEEGALHVFEVATGKEIGEPIPRVNGGTAGGSVAWTKRGFYYTRYPRAGERPPEDLDFYQQVYYHDSGGAPDVRVLDDDLPRIAEITLQTSDDGQYALANVSNGDGGEHAIYVRAGSRWTKVAGFADKVVYAEFGRDNRVYLVSHAAPRGQILRVRPQKPRLADAELVVPEGDGVIANLEVTSTRIWIKRLAGGPSTLEARTLDGKDVVAVTLPPVSRVGEIARLHDDIIYQVTTYLDPMAWYQVSPRDAKTPRKTGMVVTSPVDFSDSEVVQSTCASKDGTKVPIAIVRRKDAPKPGPTLFYAYGGYGVNMEPSFLGATRAWIEQGGTYARASLRGGGELGDDWHEQGRLTRKQNVFDDFAACAKLLHDGYAGPDQLAIEGGSNGGLLMGAALTQHPELYRAVVSHVGIYDMLRVELGSNGQFNVTEFGTVKDRSHFDALHAYSPYHHVVDGTTYPAILMLTGAHDPRVDPYHSRKMTARLQAASPPNERPILLRTSGSTGHGNGTPLAEAIAQQADLFAFLFEQLGVAYAPVQ
jgi:prolyl oligopeptidase